MSVYLSAAQVVVLARHGSALAVLLADVVIIAKAGTWTCSRHRWPCCFCLLCPLLQIIDISAKLTDKQKIEAEHYDDKLVGG
jgi:hypothetical protein